MCTCVVIATTHGYDSEGHRGTPQSTANFVHRSITTNGDNEIKIISVSKAECNLRSMAGSLCPVNLTIQSFLFDLLGNLRPSLQNGAISASRIDNTRNTNHTIARVALNQEFSPSIA
jgi:hypothetical protein